MEIIIKGIYRHYKGNYYIIEDVATDSETLEDIVVYRALYGDKKLWVRPRSNFLEHIDNETQQYRFEYVEVKNIKA